MAIDTNLFQMLPVKFPATIPQSSSCLLRCDIPLWLRHQLVTDQELSNGSTPEKRRIEVHMEMARFDFLVCSFKRCLMDSRTCPISAI